MTQTIWGLSKNTITDIRRTFADSASIYRHLGTNNKYWEPKILARKGVKESTALDLAKQYLRVLRNVNANTYSGRGIDQDIARAMYGRYKEAVDNLDPTLMGMVVIVETANDSAADGVDAANDARTAAN